MLMRLWLMNICVRANKAKQSPSRSATKNGNQSNDLRHFFFIRGVIVAVVAGVLVRFIRISHFV